jgi:SAM-dependent methyltransferase
LKRPIPVDSTRVCVHVPSRLQLEVPGLVQTFQTRHRDLRRESPVLRPAVDAGHLRSVSEDYSAGCGSIANIHLENRRIENPLPFNGQFDKVLLSFVLHGFEERRRRDILLNGYRALVPGGRLFVFDWNEFDLDCRGPVIRFFINHIECGPTRGFIRTNLRKLLLDCGFTDVEFTRYTRGLLRLASVKK